MSSTSKRLFGTDANLNSHGCCLIEYRPQLVSVNDGLYLRHEIANSGDDFELSVIDLPWFLYRSEAVFVSVGSPMMSWKTNTPMVNLIGPKEVVRGGVGVTYLHSLREWLPVSFEAELGKPSVFVWRCTLPHADHEHQFCGAELFL